MNNKKHKSLSIYFVITYFLYYLQGSLYQSGSVISQMLLFSILCICVYYLMKTITISNKPLFYRIWLIFFVTNILGFIVTADWSNFYHFNMFKNVCCVSLVFFPFYFWSYFNIISSRYIKSFLLISVPIMIFNFYLQKTNLLAQVDYNTDNLVNNAAYSFVMLLPYLIFIKGNVIFRFILSMIIMFFIIESAKRGAIIAGIFLFILFLYSISINNKKRGYFVAITLFVVIFYKLSDFLVNNDFLVKRFLSLSEGDSSGRDQIYSQILNNWSNSDSMLNILFGFGFAASITLNSFHCYAHNDWVELLSNFGLLGIIIYILLLYSIVKLIFKTRDIFNKLTLIGLSSLWFFISSFSMGYTSFGSLPLFMLVGYMLGQDSVVKHEK